MFLQELYYFTLSILVIVKLNDILQKIKQVLIILILIESNYRKLSKLHNISYISNIKIIV